VKRHIVVLRYSDSGRSTKGEARVSHGQHSYPEGSRYQAGKKNLQLTPERVRQSVLLSSQLVTLHHIFRSMRSVPELDPSLNVLGYPTAIGPAQRSFFLATIRLVLTAEYSPKAQDKVGVEMYGQNHQMWQNLIGQDGRQRGNLFVLASS